MNGQDLYIKCDPQSFSMWFRFRWMIFILFSLVWFAIYRSSSSRQAVCLVYWNSWITETCVAALWSPISMMQLFAGTRYWAVIINIADCFSWKEIRHQDRTQVTIKLPSWPQGQLSVPNHGGPDFLGHKVTTILYLNMRHNFIFCWVRPTESLEFSELLFISW